MQRRYVTIDVFTDRLFGGNPLAVVLDAAGLSTAQMQALATEFNYSETSFVLPPVDPAHHARVRIFTPRRELPFAGHPNVGTAFALAQAWPDAPETLLFEELAGLVPVRLLRQEGQVVGAELTAPEMLTRHGTLPVGAVAECLSLPPGDILIERHGPEIASVGLPFVVVELVSRAALRQAVPDLAAMARTLSQRGSGAIYLYTRAVEASERATDLQARMFIHADGMVEDPATGSATAAAVALLADLLPGPDAELSLSVRQGVDMGRPSLLQARAVKQGGVVRLVHVGGRCVPVMQGSVRLEGDGAG